MRCTKTAKTSAGIALALVLLADLCFWSQPACQIGWVVGLLAGLLPLALALRVPRSQWSRPTYWLFAGLLCLCAALVYDAGPLALAAYPVVLLLFVASLYDALDLLPLNVGATLLDARRILARAPLDAHLLYRWMRSRRRVRHPAAPVSASAASLPYRSTRDPEQDSSVATAQQDRALNAWSVAIPLGGLFFVLFCMANPVLAVHTRDLLGSAPSLEHVAFWLSCGVVAWGLQRSRPQRRPAIAPPGGLAQLAAWTADRPRTVRRCLLVCNAVFALQTLTDLTYLWGHATLPDGMTFAAFAHRGSYVLIATTLLAALFVLLALRPGAERSKPLRLLITLWIGQNLVLLASALQRLLLYVEHYGLTRMRVATMVWIVIVALGFALMAFRLLRSRSNAWLLRANSIMVLTVVCLCTFINFNGHIAWHNVRHSREATGSGVALDYTYLRQIGPESIPALRWLGRHARTGTQRQRAARTASAYREQLATWLLNWRAWTLRRSRLVAGRG